MPQAIGSTIRKLLSRSGAFLLPVLLAPAQHDAVGAEIERLQVEGTEFVVTLKDGRCLRSADLVGAKLTVDAGRLLEIRIEAVEEDRHAVGGRVVLHDLRVRNAAGAFVPLCTPDANGRALGFPVPDGRGTFDLTCTSGAVGKCVRWGYRPWEERSGGPPMRALHRACLHMTRADYGGDGSTHTREGTLIGMQDGFGIQRFNPDVAMSFEAAWGVDGAVCVARPRFDDSVALAELAQRHPRLGDAIGATACTEEGAQGNPAVLLLNRSFPARP